MSIVAELARAHFRACQDHYRLYVARAGRAAMEKANQATGSTAGALHVAFNSFFLPAVHPDGDEDSYVIACLAKLERPNAD